MLLLPINIGVAGNDDLLDKFDNQINDDLIIDKTNFKEEEEAGPALFSNQVNDLFGKLEQSNNIEKINDPSIEKKLDEKKSILNTTTLVPFLIQNAIPSIQIDSQNSSPKIEINDLLSRKIDKLDINEENIFIPKLNLKEFSLTSSDKIFNKNNTLMTDQIFSSEVSTSKLEVSKLEKNISLPEYSFLVKNELNNKYNIPNAENNLLENTKNNNFINLPDTYYKSIYSINIDNNSVNENPLDLMKLQLFKNNGNFLFRNNNNINNNDLSDFKYEECNENKLSIPVYFENNKININNNIKNEFLKLMTNPIQMNDNKFNFNNSELSINSKNETLMKQDNIIESSNKNINNMNFSRLNLESNNNSNNNADTNSYFMSYQFENEKSGAKKNSEEKVLNPEKTVFFDKNIYNQNLPLNSDLNTNVLDNSSSLASVATKRAIELTSQLHVRGGGIAKIQINDEKLGNIELNINLKKDNTVTMEIKATNPELKLVLEKNSDLLKKSLDTQNIILTDFKVSMVEKAESSGMNFSNGQGFSQHNHNNNNTFISQDFTQQNINQGFMNNNFSNGKNYFNNLDNDILNQNNSNKNYENKIAIIKNIESNSVKNVQRSSNGSIKVFV